MAVLGRRGGLVGGHSRALVLSPTRRSEIAKGAARARWSKQVTLSGRPRTPAQLAAFVAHYGSKVSRGVFVDDLEGIVLAAVDRSRRDSALARMLPVFLWRVRDQLDSTALAKRAKRRKRSARALGFFLELAGELGRSRAFDRAVAALRTHARHARPTYFFAGTEKRPFERLVALESTSPQARRWGLRMNMPVDSFASYFEKAARL